MARVDRIMQFLIDAGYEPGEPSPLPPVPMSASIITTATAPAIQPTKRGVFDAPCPPGTTAIQALDDNGEEFAYFRIRSTAFNPAIVRRLQHFLDEHVPGSRLTLLKD